MIAGTGLFGAIELGQLSDRGLDPAPDAHQSADGFFVARIGHSAPQWGLPIDGVVVALLVQALADEAFVPDQQAGDPSEPVPDDQPLIDVRRRQREGDDLIAQISSRRSHRADLIAQIGHDMAVEAEIRLLLAGAKTPGDLVLALEDLAA
jgi:hypothetical protein